MALHRLKTTTFVQLTFVFLFLLSSNAFSGGWKLFWSDEFDSTALNESNWTVNPTNNPPNGEQEQYTAGHDQAGSNIFVKNGHLIIETRNNGTITSGRFNSSNKKTFMYGRIEASMRLPLTQGMWPAFWMLGVGGGWPVCGEIDIMEGKGRLPNWTSGTFHWASNNSQVGGTYTMPTGNVHDNFHTYAIEWNTDSIRWYFDTVNFVTLVKAQHPDVPIDKQYYIIFDLAVGGNFDGNINNTTVFPESLIVDYVRVYQWDPNVGTVLPAAASPARPSASLKTSGGSVFVDLPSRQTYYFELVSVRGEKVLSARGTASSFRIDAGRLSPGVYCAAVRGAFGALTGRVVVQR
ncbi:MAG TPA: glycoside hydrolase family 16 protein [Chitinivibrionales bacterium]|nr:glycoside hydrolase family 16 protein [Chitinivibrionales bacterium]